MSDAVRRIVEKKRSHQYWFGQNDTAKGVCWWFYEIAKELQEYGEAYDAQHMLDAANWLRSQAKESPGA